MKTNHRRKNYADTVKHHKEHEFKGDLAGIVPKIWRDTTNGRRGGAKAVRGVKKAIHAAQRRLGKRESLAANAD